ncbi:MAG TPA: ABC transporter ATP-binding protein [Tepidisphaeraceae bacterium]|jgi:molybdate transport system ATP-binding protein
MSERSAELVADFEKRYRSGAIVRAAFAQPSQGFFSTVLFGPSGSGKTTILRCLAGLERPEGGTIRNGPQTWFDAERRVHLRPQARGVGFLFQDYALFPHLTVERNVGYGLSRASRALRRSRVAALMDLLGLSGLDRRYPRELSAGQQQRVALARAVAPRPKLLLLDEPLSALDAPTRQTLRGELRRALATLATPAVLVTHDPLEAVALADQAVVLNGGQIRQKGPIHEVFSRPADPTVARIVGVETIEPATLMDVCDGLAFVRAGSAELLALDPGGLTPGPVYVCIRGEEVTLERSEPAQSSARNRLPARVIAIHPEGATVRVLLDCGFSLTAQITRPAAEQLALAPGQSVVAQLKAPAIHLVAR